LSGPAPDLADLRAAVKGTNLIIVVLDAMRADHLGSCGYDRDTTPNIDRLARESVVFEQHFCQFTQTTCSTASLFTGQYPDTHGLVYERRGELRDGSVMMDPEAFTLAKAMEKAGCATSLISANAFASPKFGVGEEFQDAFLLGRRQLTEERRRGASRAQRRTEEIPGRVRTAPRLLEVACNRIADMKGKRFFTYVHFLPPHYPYEASREVIDRYRSKQPPGYWQGEPAFTQVYFRTWGDAPPATGADWVNLYDANLRWADQALGGLIAFLEESNLLEKSLLIVTADHGEALGEHRYEFHATCPYDEATHIPLLIRFPGGKGPVGRVRVLTETVDVLPTLMELYGLWYPREMVQGRSLTGLLTGEREELHDYVFSRTAGHYPCYLVRSHDWALLLYKGGKLRALYDLRDDPRQRYNVAEERADQTGKVIRRFEQFARSQRYPPLHFADPNQKPPAREEVRRKAVSEETMRELKALGYVD
jgi:arylsulfatase